METKDLIEYLKYVVDVEKNIHSIDCSVEALKNKKNHLGRSITLTKPNEPTKPSLEKKKHWVHYLLIGAILIAIAVAMGASDGIVFISFWPFIFGVGCILFVIPDTIIRNRKIKKANDKLSLEYENKIDKYNIDLSTYLEKKENNAVRLKKELNEIQLIDHMIKKLIEQRKESTVVLDELYSYNIIYPKYRNLIAVCSFLDYFSSGLCYTLESPKNSVGGAYYIFENEMLHKQIIVELQQVNKNLNQIKTSQYSLFCAISESNQTLSDLNASMKLLSFQQEKGNHNLEMLIETSQISNYYASQTQKELSYLNNMQYLSGRYDSVNPLFRTPPT